MGIQVFLHIVLLYELLVLPSHSATVASNQQLNDTRHANYNDFTVDCPDHLEVTLKGTVLEYHKSRAGNFTQSYDGTYWANQHGNAIWYYRNQWRIGYLEDLYTATEGIHSRSIEANLCPNSETIQWKYAANDGTFNVADDNVLVREVQADPMEPKFLRGKRSGRCPESNPQLYIKRIIVWIGDDSSAGTTGKLSMKIARSDGTSCKTYQLKYRDWDGHLQPPLEAQVYQGPGLEINSPGRNGCQITFDIDDPPRFWILNTAYYDVVNLKRVDIELTNYQNGDGDDRYFRWDGHGHDGWWYRGDNRHQWMRTVGDPLLVSQLRITGRDVNQRSGETALHKAANKDLLEAAKWLIGQGADLEAKNSCGETPLYYAAALDSVEVACLLISRGAKVNVKQCGGWTPLHRAAYFNHLKVARLLIVNGADKNIKDTDGRKPIILAKSFEMKALLYDSGTDPVAQLRITGRDVNKRFIKANQRDRETALHIAAEKDLLEAAKWLINEGADLEAKTSAGWTPLHYAAGFDSMDVARLLISRGAKVNAKATDGKTPLHMAARFKHLKMAQLLINNGADRHIKSNSGKKPIYYAKSSEMKKLLGS